MRGPVIDSRWITVVSGRASDFKCSVPHQYTVHRPVLVQKPFSRPHSQGIEAINELEFFLS